MEPKFVEIIFDKIKTPTWNHAQAMLERKAGKGWKIKTMEMHYSEEHSAFVASAVMEKHNQDGWHDGNP